MSRVDIKEEEEVKLPKVTETWVSTVTHSGHGSPGRALDDFL
jgi:hypothetical protein